MTGPTGNSELCFSESQSLNDPRGESFVIRPNVKNTSNCASSFALDAAGHMFAHDLITCKSKVQVVCFPGKLVSFIRPRELDCFDTRHVTFRPIGKRI